jgi:uncharacterized protein YrrD
MDFKKGTPIVGANDEKVGELDRVVIDPKTHRVSHVVLRRGAVIPEEIVVPIQMIQGTEEDRIQFTGTADTVDSLPKFEETHFVMTDENEVALGETDRTERGNVYRTPLLYWYPPVVGGAGLTAPGTAAAPYLIPDTGAVNYAAEVEQNIPEGTVAVREGAPVYSNDDHEVGSVERIFVSDQNNRVTHFVISKGLLLKERKLIPVQWISEVYEDRIDLAVSAKYLDSLPDYHEQE